MERRTTAVLVAALALAGCGFQLRQAPTFAFETIYVNAAPSSPLARELRRALTSGGNVSLAAAPAAAGVILDVLSEPREKVVVGLNATGQVREFQLRIRFRFKLRTSQGRELIGESEILQQRDISFTESAALAKEAEEQLLYRDMQSEIVAQLLRRLAAVKAL